MGGFHLSSLVVVLVIGLLIAGPKALRSMSRNVGQAKAMKEKVLAELPMEEISGIAQSISKIPLSPQQAVHMLLTTEQEKKKRETKEERSPSSVEKSP